MRIGLAKTLLAACLVAATADARADHATDADLTSAASWCATTARVLRGARAGALPHAYARRTLAVARVRLQELEHALDERRDTAHRDRLVETLDLVRRAGLEVGHERDGSFVTLLADLDRQAAALEPSR